ncbi:MAG TPA: sigma-70 family RNA polymerase sigma factor [Candidatus Baltobacteraceae bacterium]|nr:sigma-70 family RNA polymerase sigma factor [Candidatus Baltobacteraceae bacterium]
MVAATTLIDRDDGFERFFHDEYARVVSIAYRITRDRAEAEDVAQEVFVRAARSPRLRGKGLLYTAAVRSALNLVRSKRRRLVRETRRVRLESALEHGAGAQSDPQLVLERRIDVQRVRSALLRLPQRDAELLALRYSGLSYREIASALNLDAAQIGTRLARAERALKKEMDRETH